MITKTFSSEKSNDCVGGRVAVSRSSQVTSIILPFQKDEENGYEDYALASDWVIYQYIFTENKNELCPI